MRIVMVMIMTMIMTMTMMACRNIPTLTKCHHGGEMSVMIKVRMCQCQIPTIHDKLQLEQLALVSCSIAPSAKLREMIFMESLLLELLHK